jgi:hypothetical protein
MKPYYDDGSCVIYHGDCCEIDAIPGADWHVRVEEAEEVAGALRAERRPRPRGAAKMRNEAAQVAR